MKKQLLALLLLAAVTYAQDTTDTADSADTADTAAETSEQSDEDEHGLDDDAVFNVAQSGDAPFYLETVGYTYTNDNKVYASPKALFEIQGVDDESGLRDIQVSVDGGPYSAYKNPIAFSTEGEHTLSYKFIDRVGNTSYSRVFSVDVDATPPRVLRLVLNPAPYTASGNDYVGLLNCTSFVSFK